MKTRWLLLIVLPLLLALGTPVAAEAPAGTGQYFGMGAGAVTGWGLLYRDWRGPVGWQVVGIPLLTNSSLSADLGLTTLWMVNDAGWTKFFVYAGGMGSYATSTYNNGEGLEVTTLSWRAAIGVGIGLEVLLWDHIALDIQGGLQAGLETASPLVGPTGEVALSYRL